jgi:lipoprotein NlpI
VFGYGYVSWLLWYQRLGFFRFFRLLKLFLIMHRQHFGRLARSATLISAVLLAFLPADARSASKSEWEGCKASDPETSIKACSRILARRGESARDRASAYYNRGIAYADQRDDRKAIEDFNEAVRLDPRHPGAYTARGRAYNREGDTDAALRDFARALAIDPKYPYAFNGRGETYELLQNLDAALENYEAAIKTDPRYALAYTNRGDVYLYRGEFARAIASYDESIKIRSRNPNSFRHRAIAHLYSGESAKALADITQATELAPKGGRDALWLAIIGRRNFLRSRLSERVEKIDMTRWPSPIVRLYLNQSTLSAVVAAADHSDEDIKKDRLCEVSFFAGVMLRHADQKGRRAAC